MPTSQQRDERPFQFSLLALFVVTTVACFVFARPAIAIRCAGSLALFTLGLACVRGALTHRVSGWISGLAFGTVFLALGAAACIWSFGAFVDAVLKPLTRGSGRHGWTLGLRRPAVVAFCRNCSMLPHEGPRRRNEATRVQHLT